MLHLVYCVYMSYTADTDTAMSCVCASILSYTYTLYSILHIHTYTGTERLKKACESVMLDALSIETAGHILLAADSHNADRLREKALNYIINHFDDVSKTYAFEEMTRLDVELLFEILHRR